MNRQKLNLRPPGFRYRLLAIPLYLFWILHALKHGLKHDFKPYLSMRFFGFAADNKMRVWVHASSVGEVHAVTPLVHAMMQQGEHILFTSFTATGYRAIRNGFADSVTSGVIPVDHFWHCRMFFRQHSIKLGLVMETELWPELLYQARRRDIDLILVNARLSQKSLNTGKFVRGLMSTTLAYFNRLLARNRQDQDALLSMGANQDRIRIVGNLKSRRSISRHRTRLIDRDYLILASSHSGEELQFLQTRPDELKHQLIVIAPRHPHRSASIQTQIGDLGMSYSVRSKAQPIERHTEIYLADTLGELQSLMAYARIVIMGGSFDTTGGHNLIEPASLGCAIITGPSDDNVADDIEMLGVQKGVLQVENMDACWGTIVKLLANPSQTKALGIEAQSRLARQPDMIQQYMATIVNHL